MFDLKQISPIQSAKLGIVVTILVLTSACAHKVLVRPANNDSGVQEELSQQVPEPEVPAQVSSLTQEPTKAVKAKKKSFSGKKVAKHKRKAKKSTGMIARHKKHKSKQVVTTAAVKDIAPPAPPAPPAPEIALPMAPAPFASASVQTGIDEGPSYGVYLLYGFAALSVIGLIWIAPRARRTSRPKRKLVYNG